MTLIDTILEKSGPFGSEAARVSHGRWLATLDTPQLEQRLKDLLDSEGRRPGAASNHLARHARKLLATT